ncbi:hypothetical protein SCORR_v1c01360 [Spiroplasma corruscae]|uniref:Uncharacterized protein n=1 Tax=Spiroplasma corruscae TaxID=216934 RepID=A0A222ENB8_9MOLU|nr:hypothetical protein [Spiroplasma corruscae]ASP27911.1 hypothetical protein SCORR_v1c01360 [Spiroplasma corruscae]
MIIFSLNINNQELREKENDVKQSLSQTTNDNKELGFDIVFINEIMELNGKNFYKLFLRPNYSYEYLNDLMHSGSNLFYKDVLNCEFKLYLGTNSGLVELENPEGGKTFKAHNFAVHRLFLFKPEYIVANGANNFFEINIPVDLIKDRDSIDISFEIKYFFWDLNTPKSNVGKIKVDLKNYVKYEEVDNLTKKVRIFNKVTVLVCFIPFVNEKYTSTFLELVSQDVTLKEHRKDIKFIDRDYTFISGYNKYNFEAYSYIITNYINRYIDAFVNDINTSHNIKVTSELLSNLDYSKYYSLKKIEDTINEKDGVTRIGVNNKTQFKYPSNAVGLCEGLRCEEGILFNPIFGGTLMFSKTINKGGLIIDLSYNIDTNNNYPKVNSKLDNSEKYKINYKVSINYELFNKYINKDLEGGINYINENQEKIA